MSRELARLRDRERRPLTSITRRFSAVDARYLDTDQNLHSIEPGYSLADQLFVQPQPRLLAGPETRSRIIQMTRQELAVARSHIEVWRLIAGGDVGHTLVLEDDAFFTRTFARIIDRAWAEAVGRHRDGDGFDMLYLSYQEAAGWAPKRWVSETLFAPISGMWQLSGYVLSKSGAHRLLDLLPVRGPVDLWINHQFKHLNVLAPSRPIIKQRMADPSTNSYSVLPVLAQVGALTREKPLLPKRASPPSPVFVAGASGTGCTELAAALSMLGYRCCSDVTRLPDSEHSAIIDGRRRTVFGAYVNVGGLGIDVWPELAKRHRDARFIVTVDADTRPGVCVARSNGDIGTAGTPNGPGESPVPMDTSLSAIRNLDNVLFLPRWHRDKWDLLCRFLARDYPSYQWPDCEDLGQRPVDDSLHDSRGARPHPMAMRWDVSPWIIDTPGWAGIRIDRACRESSASATDLVAPPLTSPSLNESAWFRRDDTFPGNLAMFEPKNVYSDATGPTHLWLRQERGAFRDYTAAAIASRELYRYGRFAADLRASDVAGVITGLFLHRNAPRQEIDIELRGKDTGRMLINVYYNPGGDGDRLEYGYRGTPALIDLGFDASAAFHRYEIEWQPEFISWRVDGEIVHQRVNWDPTPIPQLPMEFNINVWPSKSKELAGRLTVNRLPTYAEVRRVGIDANIQTGPGS